KNFVMGNFFKVAPLEMLECLCYTHAHLRTRYRVLRKSNERHLGFGRCRPHPIFDPEGSILMSSPVPMSSEPPMQPPLPATQSDVNQLSVRVSALEARFPATSWFFGPSFLKRAFAVWGHWFVIQIILAIIIWVLVFGC